MKLKFFIISLLLLSSYTSIKAQYAFLDTSFNKTGLYTRGLKYLKLSNAEIRAVAVNAKGKIVAAVSVPNSNTFYVFRLNPDGTPDSLFGGNTGDSVIISATTIQKINSLIIQPDGKILLAGHRNSSLGDPDMMVMRLNYDGTPDLNFGTAGVWLKDFNQKSDSVTKIALQTNGNIIVAGTKDSMGVTGAPYSKMVISCLRPDGKEDVKFQQFISSSSFYNENVTGLALYKDTIFVATNFYNGTTQSNYNSVIKLEPNGTPGWSGRRNFISSASVNDLAVRQNGDIFLAGNDYYYFYLTKINPNGLINPSVIFNQSGMPVGIPLKNILLDNDGKIILSGQAGTSYLLSIKADENGKLDSTFGISGKLIIYGASNGYKTFNQSIFSHDHKLLLVGQDVKNPYPSITKVYIRPIVHILGGAYAIPGTNENYQVQIPSSFTGVSYTWTYSGLYAYPYPNVTNPSVSIAYSDSATSGTLTCTIRNVNGAIMGIDQLEIVINKKSAIAKQLQKPTCSTNLTDCALGYIDQFSLNTLTNAGSGCSNTGYSDYTQSNFTDSLAAGGVYTAKLKIPNDGATTNYVGIWIDYNNDGTFSNLDEFVGEGYSNSSKVEISIFLKNREGYDGPKRLRVRSRPDTIFSSSESCTFIKAVGSGETEDYLIVLEKQPTLEAPQIITPNDDGINDYFVLHGTDPNKKNKLTVFDRIGAVKFSTSNYENDWKGISNNGERMSPGTYYYVITSGKTTIKGFLEIRY